MIRDPACDRGLIVCARPARRTPDRAARARLPSAVRVASGPLAVSPASRRPRSRDATNASNRIARDRPTAHEPRAEREHTKKLQIRKKYCTAIDRPSAGILRLATSLDACPRYPLSVRLRASASAIPMARHRAVARVRREDGRPKRKRKPKHRRRKHSSTDVVHGMPHPGPLSRLAPLSACGGPTRALDARATNTYGRRRQARQATGVRTHIRALTTRRCPCAQHGMF